MIKLIAMDMDGTLLTSENIISPNTKEMLLQAQKQGIRLVLASGRSYRKLMEYAKELHMDKYGGYLLEVNGMALYDLEKNTRHVRAQLESNHLQELFTYFKQWDVEVLAQFDDGLFDYNPPSIRKEKEAYRKEHHLPEDFPWTSGAFSFLMDYRNGYPHISYINSWEEIKRSVNKVSVTQHPDIMAQVSPKAKEDLQDRYWLGLTTPRWLEIMPKGITKGSGLQELANTLGIAMSEVMAFGDGENDVDMLQVAGIGIAMENAMASVKSIADDVTKSNEQDGIAYALRKYIG